MLMACLNLPILKTQQISTNYIAVELEKESLNSKDLFIWLCKSLELTKSFVDVLDTDIGKVSNKFLLKLSKGVIIKSGNFSSSFNLLRSSQQKLTRFC